jgi:predicted methyltransferase
MRLASPVLFVLLAAACGGPAPAPSYPPLGEIPTPPEARAPSPPASAASVASAATPTKPPEAARPPPPQNFQQMVAATDRTDTDRQLDPGRHPSELLSFLNLAPGMRVAEIGAGGGYTTELLARAVGPQGKVWAQNNPGFLKFVEKPWKDRLGRPAMKNTVRVDREFDAPLPPDAKNLDAVVSVLIYHDTVWLGTDRDKMNKAVFAALKKGGQYVIVDHSAAAAHGTADVKTLHRIDEATVVQEVERAGFKHALDADFLRNANDTRDWNDAPNVAADRRGTSDRFAIKFVRP